MAACGFKCTAIVDEHGEVWAFGRGGLPLGPSTNADQLLPARVGGCDFFGALVILVATGRKHAAAVAADGSLHTLVRLFAGLSSHSEDHRAHFTRSGITVSFVWTLKRSTAKALFSLGI